MAEPPSSIISGVAYLVTHVHDRPPQQDADFAGELSLHVSYDPPDSPVTDQHLLTGVGMVSDSGIFFNEKDLQGKDVRRWRIARQQDRQEYVATQGLF